MIKKELYAKNGHAWYVFCRDPDKPENIIDTNEYLIVSDGEALAMDPGGTEVFSQVVGAFSEVISVSSISTIFGSHQDPDILSSLPLWQSLCPDTRIYLPWMWASFVAHFDLSSADQFVPVPDEGIEIPFRNGRNVELVPAHYCHSSGNYSLYDPLSRILFSGDIGAALMPDNDSDIFVTDFDEHTRYMKGFHERWMPSNRAKNDWVARVRELDIDMLCPQHGSIFVGDQVAMFLDWFEALEVGTGIPPTD